MALLRTVHASPCCAPCCRTCGCARHRVPPFGDATQPFDAPNPTRPPKPTASKLSNGVALTISDLGKEPAKGLLRVVVSCGHCLVDDRGLRHRKRLLLRRLGTVVGTRWQRPRSGRRAASSRQHVAGSTRQRLTAWRAAPPARALHRRTTCRALCRGCCRPTQMCAPATRRSRCGAADIHSRSRCSPLQSAQAPSMQLASKAAAGLPVHTQPCCRKAREAATPETLPCAQCARQASMQATRFLHAIPPPAYVSNCICSNHVMTRARLSSQS